MADERSRQSRNLIGLGWTIAATLVFYTLGGYWLDKWLGTNPWLLLTGAVLGMVAVGVQVWRVTKELDSDSDSDS